ncbi:MAG TPA: sigma-54-dependent Fis family transcriptional regulator [bacterium]|nr:sigma-54-dependent Fis family transcriptional regulator [bacterium]HEX67678.1 sigma-54-dependent Fis family transcriptional regulator [bacterium]
MARILIVDDEIKMARLLEITLKNEGYQVEKAYSSHEALKKIKSKSYDVVVTDLKMPGMDGIELLRIVKKNYPSTQVIMITAFGTIQSAVKAMKEGAFHYLTKPLNLEELKEVLKGALKVKKLEEENILLRQEILGEGEIIGKSKAIKEVMELARKVAPEDTTVLLQGETGTGKELVARAIHKLSPRKNGPYVVVNCAAIPENLLESELFGHRKGAFTGALKDKKGRIEIADGGTLFLDEIGSLSLPLQAKLLRFLETKEIQPLGSEDTFRVDVRVIAATNQDLRKRVEEGNFREDLFYRLNVFPIYIPPLRERKEDIPLLANYFLKLYSKKMNKKIEKIDDGAMELLLKYSWPGNVRELENVIERAVVLADSPIVSKEFLPLLPACEEITGPYQERKKRLLENFEREYFKELLQKHNGIISKVAKEAGIDRKNLYLKLKKWGINPQDFRGRNTT